MFYGLVFMTRASYSKLSQNVCYVIARLVCNINEGNSFNMKRRAGRRGRGKVSRRQDDAVIDLKHKTVFSLDLRS